MSNASGQHVRFDIFVYKLFPVISNDRFRYSPTIKNSVKHFDNDYTGSISNSK